MDEKKLKPEKKHRETYSPDILFVSGDTLRERIYGRVQKIEQVHATLLEEIADLLRRGTTDEGDPAGVAAEVLVALSDNYNLSAHAMSIRSFIVRAAELQAEQRDLVRFGKNLMPGSVYELSWEEADRFGL